MPGTRSPGRARTAAPRSGSSTSRALASAGVPVEGEDLPRSLHDVDEPPDVGQVGPEPHVTRLAGAQLEDAGKSVDLDGAPVRAASHVFHARDRARVAK